MSLVESQVFRRLSMKATALRLPLDGSLELTPLCNMDCKMCYVKMTADQQEAIAPLKSKEEWLAMAEELKSAGVLYLLLTGGEPFSRKDFKDIYIALQSMGFFITINSNGTLIDEKVMEWLRDYPPARINITMYGASDETYKKLCMFSQGFTRVTRGIRLLLDAGIDVKVNFTVTSYNKGDMETVISLIKEWGMFSQVATYIFPPMRKDASAIGYNDRMSPEEAAYVDIVREICQSGEEKFLAHLEAVEQGREIQRDMNEDCMADGVLCRAGRSSFWMTWDGRMSPCGMMDRPVAYPFQDGFQNAWDQIVEKTEKIRLAPECTGCSLKQHCRPCAAMNLTETGSFDKVPQYRCAMAKAFLTEGAKVREKLIKEKSKGIS